VSEPEEARCDVQSGVPDVLAENLLCVLHPLILLSFCHRVIKNGVRNPLYFGLQNQGLFLMYELIGSAHMKSVGEGFFW